MLDTIDIDEDVEAMLQEAHDEEFTRPAYRVYVERCGTCQDQPLWGCKAFGCDPDGCFLLCPECGRLGFTAGPTEWVADHDLAHVLRERLDKPHPIRYTD